MHTIPLLLYVTAALAYGAHFRSRHAGLGRGATTLLAAAALAHTFVMGMQTMASGHVPVTGSSQAISTFVWLLALAYLYMEATVEERALGVFIVPLLVALQAIRAFDPAVERRVPILESPWFGVHVGAMLFAYASFALACVVSITYVLLFKEIKKKQVGFFYARLPSLDALDLMNSRTVRVGWVFLTIGLAAGAFWAVHARGGPIRDPRVDAMSLADPKILAALACWVIYTIAIAARRLGWGGRRAAYLSALGFAVILLNFVPIGYFLTRSHSFR